MRHVISFLLVVTVLALAGCEQMSKINTKLQSADSKISSGDVPTSRPVGIAAQTEGQQGQQQGRAKAPNANLQMVSLANPAVVQTAIDRKIIRNGELFIELDAPTEGQRKITAIAEAHGGFVVNSEFKQNEGSNQPAASATVTVVVRVPAAQFVATMREIEGIGGRVKQRKETGQDVTEEYIDLEARIRTKRALEAQFLEIMKQAHKVSDALEVQSQLAEVRTEIERLEGRRRFLENQSALSTITVTLQTPAPVVAATTAGFFQSVKQAVGNSIDLTTDIILGLISLVIVLIPILLLIVLPGFLLWRFFSRRWFKKTPIPETE